MVINNDLPDIEIWDPINSSQLSYAGKTEVEDLVRMATDKNSTSKNQCVCNKTPTLKKVLKPYSKDKDRTIKDSNFNSLENILNIQLLYNINQAMKPDIWNSNFHLVSLHSSIKHLASDVKNIRESLYHMMKYILNKSTKNGKANKVNDLKGIGETAWDFILSLYKSG